MENEKLSGTDKERYKIVRSCIEKEITNAIAAAQLGISIRQIRRLKRAVEKHGGVGVVHGNRSRTPWNATPSNTKTSIVAFLKKKQHRDFGPTFAMEQLLKQKKIVLSRESLRAIMADNDLWKSSRRAGPAIHRQWRERKPLYGELVQFDGSYHDWFENGDEECLLGAIDDATGTIMCGVFDENEGVVAVFRFWWKYLEKHGRPVAVYLDKFSTYKVNHKSAVDNEEMMTQFKQAMVELDIRVINANSPEAKGRIERLFGTLQDRLVKELRLVGISNRKGANRFLTDVYVPEHNERFAVRARSDGDAHRPLTDEMRSGLSSIFSLQSQRSVTNDFTFRFKNQWYQLAAQQEIAVYRGDAVTIEERLDGSIHVRLKDAYLSFIAIAKLERAARPRVVALTREKPRWKPPADHPWRRAAARAAEHKNAKKSRNAR